MYYAIIVENIMNTKMKCDIMINCIFVKIAAQDLFSSLPNMHKSTPSHYRRSSLE